MESRDVKRNRISFPPLLEGLVMHCETVCVSGCCGLDAFDFSEEQFRLWLHLGNSEVAPLLAEELEEVLRVIEVQSEEEVSSDRLNHSWSKAQAVAFFSELHRRLKGVL